MTADEVTMLREALSAHRAVLEGARSGNVDLDLERALVIHAGLAHILAHWTDFSVGEHRRIIATVESFINPIDHPADGGPAVDDLRDPDGFADDWVAYDWLRSELGLDV